MQAWLVESLGTPPRLATVDSPIPAQGEALVRVAAAGLNFADLLMLDGRYQVRPPLPFVPGMECAGVVEALGPSTTAPAPGTRVLAAPGQGALGEYITLPADRLSPLPDAITLEEAAGFPIAYGTSHLALEKARLSPGETLLVTGAAGGVGLTAVEIGKRMGARVIAVARGADRLAVAQAAGADELLDSSAEPSLKDRLRALGGVDVVFDTVGGPGFDDALRACRPDGRLLAIGFASGEVPQVPANLLLVKNLTVTGFWYGGYQAHAPRAVAESMATLLRWRGEGLLRPQPCHVLPFEALPEGLALLRDRKVTGKVVIRVQQQ